MKRGLKLFLLVSIAALISSCGAYKQVAYLQNSSDYIAEINEAKSTMYDALIMPKDFITISVSTSDPAVAIPFNLTVPTTTSASSNSATTQPALQKYLVDNDGCIVFPIVGKLKIGGLTKGAVESLIVEKLKTYLKETPIVSVRMTNYNISVLGEVSRPGTFTIDNEKVTIFEALAMAGDMTVYGQRKNVKVIREDATGKRIIVELDITKSDIMNSPYYYLQQNDVLYVTPNKAKSRNASITSSTTIWFSIISSVLSIVTLLVSILL